MSDGPEKTHALDTCRQPAYRGAQEVPMQANDIRPSEALRYGAYICLAIPDTARATVRGAPVQALAERLALKNEFDGGGDPPGAIAFLRRVSATPADIADDGL